MKRKKQKLNEDGLSELELAAEQAIDAVFSDTSVSVEETKSRMRGLISNIQMKLESLK